MRKYPKAAHAFCPSSGREGDAWQVLPVFVERPKLETVEHQVWLLLPTEFMNICCQIVLT
jgi:hypothetical protein